MKAVVTSSSRNGSRWRWSEVEEPTVGPSDVLVQVAAAALNHADALMRIGAYVPSDASWRVGRDRVGFELAGTVIAVGSQVTGVKPGERVMAQAGGACAQRVAVDAGLVLPLRGLRLASAAALPSGLLTEHDALTQAGFVAGEGVLITGASSGVGAIGVQLARALGAGTVVATARGDRGADLDALGADLVIDSEAGSLRDALHAAGHPGCEVVLDHVGGALLAQIVDAAPARARIVQIGRLAGVDAKIDLERLAARRLTVIGTTFRGRTLTELRELTRRVRDEPRLRDRWGALEPRIDSTFALEQPEAAAARLCSGRHAGKIVLRAPALPFAGDASPA